MFVIDVMSRVHVYEQMINQVAAQILTGLLNGGDEMPSVISLAVSWSITLTQSRRLPKAGQKKL